VPITVEAWFQRTTNRKWPMGIKWSRDRWRLVTVKGQVRDPNMLRAQYIENSCKAWLVVSTVFSKCVEQIELSQVPVTWPAVVRYYG